MSFYEQLLQDSGFLRSITNEVTNSSDTYSEGDFLARFEHNVNVRNAHVSAELEQGTCKPVPA